MGRQDPRPLRAVRLRSKVQLRDTQTQGSWDKRHEESKCFAKEGSYVIFVLLHKVATRCQTGYFAMQFFNDKQNKQHSVLRPYVLKGSKQKF